MAYRHERVESLIHEEVSKLLFQELDYEGTLVTVTKVSVSPDGQHAAVFLSVMPAESSDAMLKKIERRAWRFQQILNKRLRIRPVPKLRFAPDTTSEQFERIDRALKAIPKEITSHVTRRGIRKTKKGAR